MNNENDSIEEVQCHSCGGAGKLRHCRLCSDTGYVMKYQSFEYGARTSGGSFSMTSKPCPNGCRPLLTMNRI